MPSDIPPTSPIRSAGSAGGAPETPSTGDGGPRTTPTILNPALRRYWHREDDSQELGTPRKRRLLGQSMSWAVAIGVMVGAAIMFERIVTMMEAPDGGVQPGSGGGGPVRQSAQGGSAPLAAPPPPPLPEPAALPDLLRAYGRGAVIRAEELARRHGLASGEAVACGMQQSAWAVAVSNALADDITDRLPSFDEGTTAQVRMQDHVRARFRVGQMAAQTRAAPGREAACASLARSPDYLSAVRLARDAKAKAEWDAWFRPEPVPEFNPKSAAGVRPGSADE